MTLKLIANNLHKECYARYRVRIEAFDRLFQTAYRSSLLYTLHTRYKSRAEQGDRQISNQSLGTTIIISSVVLPIRTYVTHDQKLLRIE